jgi:hypothetical protein
MISIFAINVDYIRFLHLVKRQVAYSPAFYPKFYDLHNKLELAKILRCPVILPLRKYDHLGNQPLLLFEKLLYRAAKRA